MPSVYIPVKLYVDDILICTVHKASVDGLIQALHSKGIFNVHVEEK